MKILIRDGDWWLGHELSRALEGQGHQVTIVPYDTAVGHDDSTDSLVKGVDALVVFGYNREPTDATSIIDHSTRQLYNLLFAASEAGVKRCVYISSLKLFSDYEENLTVTEKWRSLPPTDDVPLLACHLGEVVCKEFARDRLIQVVTLRLGFPIVAGNLDSAESTGESAATCSEDAIDAITGALTSESAPQWQDIHVQGHVSNQRYLTHTAQDSLGATS